MENLDDKEVSDTDLMAELLSDMLDSWHEEDGEEESRS